LGRRSREGGAVGSGWGIEEEGRLVPMKKEEKLKPGGPPGTIEEGQRGASLSFNELVEKTPFTSYSAIVKREKQRGTIMNGMAGTMGEKRGEKKIVGEGIRSRSSKKGPKCRFLYQP